MSPRPEPKTAESFSPASRRSLSATIAYRRYTASVLCPVSFIAVERGTPARSRLRTALRRRSCGSRPGTPALRQAVFHEPRKRADGLAAPMEDERDDLTLRALTAACEI
jgi:hypothetical protein